MFRDEWGLTHHQDAWTPIQRSRDHPQGSTGHEFSDRQTFELQMTDPRNWGSFFLFRGPFSDPIFGGHAFHLMGVYIQ